jgi:DNA-binding NarL/FixJ family response regulator
MKQAARSKPHTRSSPSVERPIALVLIDDNRLLREGLAAMIQTEPGFNVLAAAADLDEALRRVRAAKPDVILLDLGLADHDSLQMTATVRGEIPDAKVIVMGFLSVHEDVADYVRAGASGFIM